MVESWFENVKCWKKQLYELQNLWNLCQIFHHTTTVQVWTRQLIWTSLQRNGCIDEHFCKLKIKGISRKLRKPGLSFALSSENECSNKKETEMHISTERYHFLNLCIVSTQPSNSAQRGAQWSPQKTLQNKTFTVTHIVVSTVWAPILLC